MIMSKKNIRIPLCYEEGFFVCEYQTYGYVLNIHTFYLVWSTKVREPNFLSR